ncbi:FOG: Transposon-encoded proteins with TYA, reverse transcriptase, integrase domains in various combinations [Plasmopara halstedii]|uniref:FOG: Transposon-encoded proteins with TYA, reverse transcriptase, integrase domains in various combinations n=1 Tax=Plasmopara halstedii TaxID=4781 RepID=A0A0P1B2Y5_PLAHL|nr:FOG: Transposon-encoded proteins with TYA, reverse transcriptase, integrase domains in various combinations [Plasmopara halstedii]CEG47805.1 FOG: Transposon-encoded proteins with TYA, reverse transcriptase, integrase domains in various combinations [Plasmopara halstedii]|eukprot:XP_024584174.1 FOG: Transposon-encoded proteins with TYA, reverse transcriptase, integrase domains in various combinations [Plasmopara halstedii]
MQVYETGPKTHAKTLRTSKAEGWRKAMLEEILALKNNGVWNVIKQPIRANLLHSKWVFKTKTDANVAVERLKVRLVTCGNEQRFGIDCALTFPAAMDVSMVKVMHRRGGAAKHGDIPNTHVKADKEKNLNFLLHVPSGLDIKAKQLNEEALELKNSLNKSHSGRPILRFNGFASNQDLGSVSKFLGGKMTARDAHAHALDQEEAIFELSHEHGMASANPTWTPLSDDCYEDVLSCYIAFAAHKATQQTHASCVRDWKLAKRIAHYLSERKVIRLEMRGNADCNGSMTLESYSDADFAADKGDRKSLTGGIVLLSGMPVRWAAKKQGGISLSTMEAEFVAAFETARELLRIQEMIKEVGLALVQPKLMHVSNQAAIRQIEGKTSSIKA